MHHLQLNQETIDSNVSFTTRVAAILAAKKNAQATLSIFICKVKSKDYQSFTH
jgi:hypothetical protein